MEVCVCVCVRLYVYVWVCVCVYVHACAWVCVGTIFRILNFAGTVMFDKFILL